MARAPKPPKQIDALKHDTASRKNIPTAEMESFFLREEDSAPRPPIAYPRARPLAQGETRQRDGDLDPQLIWNGASIRITPAQMEQLAATGSLELGDAQLVWRGKDTQDWSDLIVNVPPLYIQEKIHPKAIIDDLKRRAAQTREAGSDAPDLFADFNGIAPDARAEFYQHDQHWSNRMILGDSLQVMASLAERESLRGKVQCIYFDPPYGIKFNSNWQVSTRSTKVEDGKQADISREPEQVKAFRDTWKDNIHSYLTYLRDRLTVMRDLLTESGSIFVQIGDENVHRVRAVLDEVFGEANFGSLIAYKTSVGLGSSGLDNTANFVLWYFKEKSAGKVRSLLRQTVPGEEGASRYKTLRLPDLTEMKVPEDDSDFPEGARYFRDQGMTSRTASKTTLFEFKYNGISYRPNSGGWRTSERGMNRVMKSDRFLQTGKTLSYRKYYDDFSAIALDNVWSDVSGGVTSRADPKVYVVQTGAKVIERCILMATDPGDLVLDPTCGSGTTAYVAEQWGRRWITMDTSGLIPTFGTLGFERR